MLSVCLNRDLSYNLYMEDCIGHYACRIITDGKMWNCEEFMELNCIYIAYMYNLIHIYRVYY